MTEYEFYTKMKIVAFKNNVSLYESARMILVHMATLTLHKKISRDEYYKIVKYYKRCQEKNLI